jgi:hypothetical protein
VSWEGYSEEYNTWEPRSSFINPDEVAGPFEAAAEAAAAQLI